MFAFFYEHRFFVVLALGLFLILLYLIPLQNRLCQTQSAVQLRIQDVREKMNLLESEIKHEGQSIEAFHKKIIDYDRLKGLTEKLGMCLSLEETSQTLVSEVSRLFSHAQAAVILYILHAKTGELGISFSQKGEQQINIKSKKGDIFDQWVAQAIQPLLVEDSKKDYRFDLDKLPLEDNRTKSIRSLMGVPLMVGHKVVGILRVDSCQENRFDTKDLRLLKTIADVGAVAIENAQLYERVEQLAIKDSLTKLYLRRYFLERLSEETVRELRAGKPLSFVMIDLDCFKEYNDKFGHVAGDIVLSRVGLILADFFKGPGNLICRYGGEEFSVLLPDCSKRQALDLADEVRKKIERQPIFLRRQKTHITVSLGVASFPKDAQTKEELVLKADQALYKAKQEGRNKVCGA